MSILENYLKQCEEDKLNENDNLPQSSTLVEGDKESYRQELQKLRQEIDPTAYLNKLKEITFTETDFVSKGCIKNDEQITEIRVIRAYCPKCGKELTTNFPPMYNPYTGNKQCIHKCECGEQYNLEYCYPRLAYFVGDNEINAFGL